VLIFEFKITRRINFKFFKDERKIKVKQKTFIKNNIKKKENNIQEFQEIIYN